MQKFILFYFCSPSSFFPHTVAFPSFPGPSPPLLSLSLFAPAALASSCRHSETQHTSPHQGHSTGTRVLMCVSLCVCLERSLQWGHIGCEPWPVLILKPHVSLNPPNYAFVNASVRILLSADDLMEDRRGAAAWPCCRHILGDLKCLIFFKCVQKFLKRV